MALSEKIPDPPIAQTQPWRPNSWIIKQFTRLLSRNWFSEQHISWIFGFQFSGNYTSNSNGFVWHQYNPCFIISNTRNGIPSSTFAGRKNNEKWAFVPLWHFSA